MFTISYRRNINYGISNLIISTIIADTEKEALDKFWLDKNKEAWDIQSIKPLCEKPKCKQS